jgi:hypothetical protein
MSIMSWPDKHRAPQHQAAQRVIAIDSRLANPDAEPALAILAPLDKRALGVAFGVAVAISVAAATVFCMVTDPEGRIPLRLLSQFFAGYSVSREGIAIGAAWGFVTGFVWGWFLAFTRNLVLAVWLVWVRVRADVEVSRDLLDHI